MWLYYCKLRGANDFESVNQLIVADKMFEMLDSETATHIGVLQGEEWYKPVGTWANNVIYFTLQREIYDEPERAKWNDSEKRSFNGSGVYVPIGLATGGQVNVVHQQVLCALAEVFGRRRVASTRGFGYIGEEPRVKRNSLAQSSQDLRVDSGNVDETEVSLGILPEKAQEHIEGFSKEYYFMSE
ncbi:uncharacterized protein TNCV_1300551 [Trichonephila clavipes]|nr:uncharacterized protein TNCV_1300551 [Trichonephila clavipes]